MEHNHDLDQRRVRRVVLEHWTVEDVFTGDLGVVEGLPDDATFLRFYGSEVRDEYTLIFQSDEFEPVPEGDVIPKRHLTVRDFRHEE